MEEEPGKKMAAGARDTDKTILPLPYRDSGFLKSCNTCRVVAFEKSSDFEKA